MSGSFCICDAINEKGVFVLQVVFPIIAVILAFELLFSTEWIGNLEMFSTVIEAANV